MGKCPSLDLKKEAMISQLHQSGQSQRLSTHTRNSSMNTTEEYEGKNTNRVQSNCFQRGFIKNGTMLFHMDQQIEVVPTSICFLLFCPKVSNQLVNISLIPIRHTISKVTYNTLRMNFAY